MSQPPADGGQMERLKASLLRLVPAAGAELVGDHLERLDPEYLARYDESRVAEHIGAVAELKQGRHCRLLRRRLEAETWEITAVAFDHQGIFSLIAGCLASEGINIVSGEVWTYAESARTESSAARPSRFDLRFTRLMPRRPRPSTDSPETAFLRRKKIVDNFTVQVLEAEPDWEGLETRLDGLAGMLLNEQGETARREVNAQVVEYLSRTVRESEQKLLPVRVDLDNDSSERYTVMDIRADDTPAFLYLFTNALAMRGVDIRNIRIRTRGGKVEDRFYITDRQGAKITGEQRTDQLRFIVALVKQFSHLLVRSPDPTMALNNFERLVERIYAEQEAPGAQGLKLLDFNEQTVMEALARLFGTSNFLWEDFLRIQCENLLPVIADLEALESYKDKATMWAECEMALIGQASYEAAADALNSFKDREMFRIDMRHILDKIDSFTEFSRELTDLAEVVIEAAYRICHSDLSRRYGHPVCEDGSPCRFAVFALGKAGGRELGYASDIELLFVHGCIGRTSGRESISNREYHEKLAQQIIRTIRSKEKGIFELDLRFRPYGNQGPLSSTLRQVEEYYSDNGQAWDFERQCLVRLRFIAGDSGLGDKVLAVRDRFVYSGRPLNIEELVRLRNRQLEEFVAPGVWNAKFSRGGLVDIEYHVQHLQVEHGAADPSVRLTGTRPALKALHAGGYLSDGDYNALREAHKFLRRLINALRILRGHARDLVVPSADSEEFSFLARRMGYPLRGEDRLAQDLEQHRQAVLKVVDWEEKVRRYREENSGTVQTGE